MSRGPIPDDFEYPTAQRETMWTLPDKRRQLMARQSAPRDPNCVADIRGAQHGTTPTHMAVKTLTRKPNLYDSRTVEGAAPRRLVPIEPGRNNFLMDKSLKTSDLPAAQPNVRQFQTQRCTDPLVPNYPIAEKPMHYTVDAARREAASPSHAATQQHLLTRLNGSTAYATGTVSSGRTSPLTSAPTTGGAPRVGSSSSAIPHVFGAAPAPDYAHANGDRVINVRRGDVRDVMQTADIFGTRAADNKSNTVIRTHRPSRDHINYSDVPLSMAGARHQREARNPYTPSMSLVTSDICRNDVVTLQSTRNTNPLAPTYTVTGPKGTSTVIGEVSGSRPRPQPALRGDRPMLSLRSDDIAGAQPLVRFGDSLTKGSRSRE